MTATTDGYPTVQPASDSADAGFAMDNDAARLRAANRRTAAMLTAIALLFFFGIIVTRFIDSAAVSTGVVGGAMLLYLMVAIGRHLRKEPPRDR